MKPPDILHQIDKVLQDSQQLNMAVRVERLLESAAPGMGVLPAEEVFPQLHEMGIIRWLGPDDFSFKGIAWYTFRCRPGSCSECRQTDGWIPRDDLDDYFSVDSNEGDGYHYSYELVEAVYWTERNIDSYMD